MATFMIVNEVQQAYLLIVWYTNVLIHKFIFCENLGCLSFEDARLILTDNSITEYWANKNLLPLYGRISDNHTKALWYLLA